MRTTVFDMTDKEFENFQHNLTFNQLEELDDEEFDEIDPDIVRTVVEEEDFCEPDTRIYYKEKYNVPLDDEDERYLDWESKVDYDLGPPLM